MSRVVSFRLVLASFDVSSLLSRVNLCLCSPFQNVRRCILVRWEKRIALAGVTPATLEIELELIAGLWIAYFTEVVEGGLYHVW